MRIFKSSLAFLLLVLCASSTAMSNQDYNIVDKGTLGGSWIYPLDINEAGEIVGYGATSTGELHAFRCPVGGTLQDIHPVLGGAGSYAAGINDASEVVGAVYNPTTWYCRGYLWNAGAPTKTDAPSPGEGHEREFGRRINNSGLILGNGQSGYAGAGGTGHVLTWQRGAGGSITNPADLGSLGMDWAEGGDLNEAGQIAGWGYIGSNYTGNYPFLREQDGTVVMGAGHGFGDAINDSGLIAGAAGTTGSFWNTVAAVWQRDGGSLTMEPLGTLAGDTASWARGINDNGVVVGESGDPYITGWNNRAFVWDRTNGMRSLHDLIPANSGWTLQAARVVNDAGEIAGYGLLGGQMHVFLLQPVPEPCVAAMLALAGLVAIRRARTSRKT
jgi:probable HAF family extracellular repeat protein